MAILRGKQLSTQLSGSYIISGSTQNLIGTTTIEGATTVSGSLTLKGSSVDLNIRQNDNTNLARVVTTTNGTSQFVLVDNYYHGAQTTIALNSSSTNALTIKSGSSTVFNVDRDNLKISGSYASTGSFGRMSATGDVYYSGRIYESGTSVIDHATAMAIVFGG